MDRNNKKVRIKLGKKSHSARGAWIETKEPALWKYTDVVALREGCVDRNDAIYDEKDIRISRTPRGVRG